MEGIKEDKVKRGRNRRDKIGKDKGDKKTKNGRETEDTSRKVKREKYKGEVDGDRGEIRRYGR